MIQVSTPQRNVYEDFNPKLDAYYFKVGDYGLISFHGRNYTIKKRMSSAEKAKLLSEASFYRLTSNFYVNLDKITHIENQALYFKDKISGDKCIPVSRRTQEQVRRLLIKQNHIAI
ncbi:MULTISPECIES: LytTR family transcriptional regulator DNA-binding domain-containing protein [Paenibacillus]|uniref:LytTR family transcriptional regulator DNA-binding domain-containing protein n=1 Tax=Paenibacillus TaxID=44249 RepID=UPI0008395607|nr:MULTISPECIES: LytTR family transcriptional regulator DNA-binding domain-containing protein [Paenibacillus]GIP21338.1 hypothetical protein J22TS3_16130 [Paenibacillus sp. J22TS3]